MLAELRERVVGQRGFHVADECRSALRRGLRHPLLRGLAERNLRQRVRTHGAETDHLGKDQVVGDLLTQADPELHQRARLHIVLRGGADQHQLVDARRRQQRYLLGDLAAERVADDAGALEIQMAHQREHIAGHVADGVIMPGNAAVADVAIVRRDGAQPAAVREDEIPGGVVAHGPGDEDDRGAGAALFVPESQPVMDVSWHADKDALFGGFL